ncbi:MAG: FprA family A-type flavoprotein [Candidatus Latescibacterota bacterium]
MKPVQIKPGVYWVGAVDWNLRNFHGFRTPSGSTYNAYLVVDEKIALVDTVKRPFAEELIERIRCVVDPAKIDYLISNHVEMDHSGALPELVKAAPKATIVATEKGRKGLTRYYQSEWPFRIVKTGESLDLGCRQVSFVEVPMVHWPDSMVTHSPHDRILFSNDAFGQHLASSARFDDEVGWEVVYPEAAKYYANIVMPFGNPVDKALDALAGLEIEVIAPSHGIIWRTHLDRIIPCYRSWSSGEAKPKAVVAYDTMWGSTERMARAISEGIGEEGVEVRLYNLSLSDRSEIIRHVLDAKAIVVGSPTLNNGMFPTVAAFLTYLKGLRPKKKIGAVFGSYGWAGGATQAVAAELEAARIELVQPELNISYAPDQSDLQQCTEFGKTIAQKIRTG